MSGDGSQRNKELVTVQGSVGFLFTGLDTLQFGSGEFSIARFEIVELDDGESIPSRSLAEDF